MSFSAHIISGGEQLSEYEKHCDGQRLEYFVGVKDCQQFSIKVCGKYSKKFLKQDECIRHCVYVDGKFISGKLENSLQTFEILIAETRWGQSMFFDLVEIGGADSEHNGAGTIKVVFDMCRYNGKTSTPKYNIENLVSLSKTDLVHNGITHTTKFGEIKMTEYESTHVDFIKHLHTFVFHYRSESLLITEGIIKSTAKIEPDLREEMRTTVLQDILRRTLKRKREENLRNNKRSNYLERNVNGNVCIDLTIEPSKCTDVILYKRPIMV